MTALDRFPKPVIDGAVAILAALRDVPSEHRLDALATACDAACKTDFLRERGSS